MIIPQELLYQQYVRRELETFRAPYDREPEFYSYVKQGNTEKVKELCREPFREKKGLGILSDSPLQNLKYHFAITAAMLARYCIEGGMEATEAYDLSDYYIHKADGMNTLGQISDLHPVMCLDYTSHMEKLHRGKACSRPIALCLEYIYDHLHTRITVPALAAYVRLSPGYLSHLFAKEMGCSISSYIQNKKIETARNMLCYSDHAISVISSTLAFPSQSYFTALFREKTGKTPGQYRAEHFRSTFTVK